MAGKRFVEAAAGKVNLWLSVKGLRPDGYHEIESLFQTVSLADRVEVIARQEVGIQLLVRDRPGVPGRIRFGTARADLPGTPAGPENLAFRAAAAFFQRAGGRAGRGGVAIRLTKALPVAAGLGGGSADAAAVLRGLARLYPGALKAGELEELAADLGADVPFLLVGGTAVGRGRGEVLEELPALPEYPCLLLRPMVAVMSAEMYRRWDRYQGGGAGHPRGQVGEFYRALCAGDLEGASRLHRNDLRAVLPEGVAEAVAWWERVLQEAAGAPLVGMTGSGPTLFALFPTDEAAARARHVLCQVARFTTPPGGDAWGVELFSARLTTRGRHAVEAGVLEGEKGERGHG